jgi:hypothetical protein
MCADLLLPSFELLFPRRGLTGKRGGVIVAESVDHDGEVTLAELGTAFGIAEFDGAEELEEVFDVEVGDVGTERNRSTEPRTGV